MAKECDLAEVNFTDLLTEKYKKLEKDYLAVKKALETEKEVCKAALHQYQEEKLKSANSNKIIQEIQILLGEKSFENKKLFQELRILEKDNACLKSKIGEANKIIHELALEKKELSRKIAVFEDPYDAEESDLGENIDEDNLNPELLSMIGQDSYVSDKKIYIEDL